MSMRQWLLSRKKPYDPNKALCLTVAADGFKIGQDKVLSLSTRSKSRGPVTVYIMGADPEKTFKYTGVSTGKYTNEAVGVPRALEIIRDQLTESEFIVSYAVEKYQRGWLADTFPVILDKLPLLDVLNLVRLADSREVPPQDIHTIDELQDRLQTSLHHMKGYAMDDVCARCVSGFRPPAGSEIPLEKKIEDLWSLWLATIDR